jgi:hypothetical protein
MVCRSGRLSLALRPANLCTQGYGKCPSQGCSSRVGEAYSTEFCAEDRIKDSVCLCLSVSESCLAVNHPTAGSFYFLFSFLPSFLPPFPLPSLCTEFELRASHFPGGTLPLEPLCQLKWNNLGTGLELPTVTHNLGSHSWSQRAEPLTTTLSIA